MAKKLLVGKPVKNTGFAMIVNARTISINHKKKEQFFHKFSKKKQI